MTLSSMGYYYAPGWAQIQNPVMTQNGNSYTVALPSATYEQWQAQVTFNTDLSSSAAKTYDFYCILNSNTDHPGVTIKLRKTGDDTAYYFADRQQLIANADYVYKWPSMSGKDAANLSLLFDFGGNAANTEVTIRDIIFQEHQE